MENITYNTSTPDTAIRQNRAATVKVTLMNHTGPLANQDVLVEQKRHQFLFGSTWGESTIALANGELSGREKELAELRNERF